MKNHVYIRVLKAADQTVFCVDEGQKTYYDQTFGRTCPYSSGAQIKRSIMLHFLNVLGIEESPKTFNFKVKANLERDGNGEVWNTCDPRDIDQLIGGYMTAKKNTQPIKRRSPLSISAMRPIHPLLAGVKKDNVSFDRSESKNSVVQFVNKKGEILDKEEIFEKNKGSTPLTARTYIPNGLVTSTGYFIYDVAIDVQKLFTVLETDIDPEVSREILEELKEEGWTKVDTFNGSGYMLSDPQRRREIVEALIDGILNFRITSNQSRTFSLMDTVAISISEDAQKVGYGIRSKLIDEDSNNPKAKLIVDTNAPSDIYLTPSIEKVSSALEGGYDAIDKAKENVVNRVMSHIEVLV